MGIGEGLAILGKALGAGLCMGIGAIGPALGEGNAVSHALEGMARQPEAADNLRVNMILGCAITESTGIYALVTAILILFTLYSQRIFQSTTKGAKCVGYFEEFIGVNLWTALFTLLNTLTVIFVGTKFLFKPIMKIIADRQKEIDDMYSEAGTAKAEAQAMEAEYKEKLSNAMETGERIVKEATVRGQAKEEQIIRQANEEASALLRKAEADIAMEKKKAINDAKDEISGMAIAIAEKVVGRELNADDQGKLIDDFINELGEQV